KSIKGLNHLCQSADKNYDNGTYFYGILMLCRDNFEKGKKYMDKISWENSQFRSDQCWNIIKNSLT
ncbi:unnamed protein product, partial [Brassica oleracea]